MYIYIYIYIYICMYIYIYIYMTPKSAERAAFERGARRVDVIGTPVCSAPVSVTFASFLLNIHINIHI